MTIEFQSQKYIKNCESSFRKMIAVDGCSHDGGKKNGIREIFRAIKNIISSLLGPSSKDRKLTQQMLSQFRSEGDGRFRLTFNADTSILAEAKPGLGEWSEITFTFRHDGKTERIIMSPATSLSNHWDLVCNHLKQVEWAGSDVDKNRCLELYMKNILMKADPLSITETVDVLKLPKDLFSGIFSIIDPQSVDLTNADLREVPCEILLELLSSGRQVKLNGARVSDEMLNNIADRPELIESIDLKENNFINTPITSKLLRSVSENNTMTDAFITKRSSWVAADLRHLDEGLEAKLLDKIKSGFNYHTQKLNVDLFSAKVSDRFLNKLLLMVIEQGNTLTPGMNHALSKLINSLDLKDNNPRIFTEINDSQTKHFGVKECIKSILHGANLSKWTLDDMVKLKNNGIFDITGARIAEDTFWSMFEKKMYDMLSLVDIRPINLSKYGLEKLIGKPGDDLPLRNVLLNNKTTLRDINQPLLPFALSGGGASLSPEEHRAYIEKHYPTPATNEEINKHGVWDSKDFSSKDFRMLDEQGEAEFINKLMDRFKAKDKQIALNLSSAKISNRLLRNLISIINGDEIPEGMGEALGKLLNTFDLKHNAEVFTKIKGEDLSHNGKAYLKSVLHGAHLGGWHRDDIEAIINNNTFELSLNKIDEYLAWELFEAIEASNDKDFAALMNKIDLNDVSFSLVERMFNKQIQKMIKRDVTLVWKLNEMWKEKDFRRLSVENINELRSTGIFNSISSLIKISDKAIEQFLKYDTDFLKKLDLQSNDPKIVARVNERMRMLS